MTLAEVLSAARRRLREAGIEDEDLEAEVLLRHALGLDRAALFQRLSEAADPDAACRFENLLARRLQHEPTAYITGHREFYGLDFEVTPAVLIPRPETEHLVEAAIELGKTRSRIRRGPIFADVGTGSGAVAVALACKVPRSEVYAIDVSREALAVAARNLVRHGVENRVMLLRGDLLSPLPEYVDVLVADLPYVPTGDLERLAPEVRDHEPRSALDGGPDGLDLFRRLFVDAAHFLRPRGAVCLEFGQGQTGALREMAALAFPKALVQVRKDLAGSDRVLVIDTATTG